MILNRGGALSVEYFIAYMKLIMNTRECASIKAKEIAFERLFRNDSKTLGKESYQKFLLACDVLEVRK